MKLQILQHQHVIHSLLLDARAWTLGRASDNAIILQDPDVSGHHALLCWQDGVLKVRDLGSTNGTLLNGERVHQAPLTVGDTLALGSFVLRLQPAHERASGYALRAAGAPVARQALPGFSLPGHPQVVLYDRPSLCIDLGSTLHAITLGTPFPLDGHDYLLEAAEAVAPTVPQGGLFPYTLSVDLSAPRAVLSAPSLSSMEYRSASRVSLLYVLGKAPGEWLDNDVIGRGVWGREWLRQSANNLNVLVHRVRKKAEAAGFDRRFLERGPNSMRLALDHAQVC